MKFDIKKIVLMLIAASMIIGTASAGYGPAPAPASAATVSYTEQDTTPDIYVYGNPASIITGFENYFSTSITGSTWTDPDGRLAIINDGDFMLIETEDATTEFCIVFASDKNDGYARVYVDGNKVWSGNTYSNVELTQSIDKQTIRTLKITGLENVRHSIKIKNANCNNFDVTVYKYGYDLPEDPGENGGTEEIPEFPTIALPVAAIIGLAFIFHKREE
ncbi:PEF-CTERM sorting domain-containing protein [Methanolobus profundi]|uniref:PEF-CTERM protein sorting domain-containing protein n=1 Tax=Methanolobus profundi TaxID=487685 RepID=A0A1I4NFW7_9EURY|nr:PEF-CTERM sorting domain-containing protein [Methanolobus profundi]SFM14275.1 PEF-CTERM protein sorting domain-containing protein [Methanolobus profundi]